VVVSGGRRTEAGGPQAAPATRLPSHSQHFSVGSCPSLSYPPRSVPAARDVYFYPLTRPQCPRSVGQSRKLADRRCLGRHVCSTYGTVCVSEQTAVTGRHCRTYGAVKNSAVFTAKLSHHARSRIHRRLRSPFRRCRQTMPILKRSQLFAPVASAMCN